MLSESLRQRLETLNRERFADVARPAPRPASQPRPAVAEPSPMLTAAVLLQAQGVTEANDLGEHLTYAIPVERLWPQGPRLVEGRLEHLRAQRPSSDMLRLIDAMPHRAAFLDLETCGLAGAALFLVGLLRWVEGRPTAELLLARHYGQEQAVLASLWRRLAGIDAIATFNGKSFDWPMVMDRSRRHLLHKRMELREPAHVDILHHARRKWKQALPDCKLQTIERLVCRRARGADIPGAQIPAAYDAYVRTGRDDQMRQVLHHNALDLVTLLDIAMRVA